MKKTIFLVLLVFTTLMFQPIEVKADTAFVDAYAGDGYVPRAGYQNTAHSVIENDNNFGTSYFYSLEESSQTTEIIDYKNWLGVSHKKSVPKYDIITMRYPILLDTYLMDIDNSGSDFSFSGFNNILLIDGEKMTFTDTLTASTTKTYEFYLNTSMEYIYNSSISASVPTSQGEFGAGISSQLRSQVETGYSYSKRKTVSYSRIGDVIIDNTSQSPYYQNGEPIYANFGTRALYFLQVTAICEIIYDLDYTVVSGSWFNKKTKYYYDDTYAHYISLYHDYILNSTYNRGLYPFIYVWNSNTNSYDLVDEFKYENRVYIN